MSADNWAQCPRCTRIAQAKLDEHAAAVQAQYGKVSVEEFDEARRQHAAAVLAFEQREATFREDYEIYGAEDGNVIVDYGGECTECRLRLHFKDTHAIPGIEGK